MTLWRVILPFCYDYKNPVNYLSIQVTPEDLFHSALVQLPSSNINNYPNPGKQQANSPLTLHGDHEAVVLFILQSWKYLLPLEACLESACLAAYKPVGGVLANSNWIYNMNFK